jgi:putative peptidoglycan lipid II flippase
LFEHGKFGAFETKQTSSALIAFSFGLPAYVLTKVLAPNFFARGDTKTPVKIASVGLILNVVLCLLLMFKFGHVGIACATSISSWVSSFIFVYILKKNEFIKLEKNLIIKIKKICLSSFIMGFALLFALHFLSFYFQNWLELNNFFKIIIFFSLVFFGSMVFFIIAILSKATSIKDIKSALRK